MPGIMGRLSTVLKAKMSTAMDKAENPSEMLDYSYEKQMEMLQQVRRGIADVATSKAQLDGQMARLNEQGAKLDGQARQAMSLGREDLARAALTRKTTLTSQLQNLQQQSEQLGAQQAHLQDGEARLMAKIEAFKTHKESMKAQYTAAQASVRINEAATGLSEEMGDVQLAMERAQNRIDHMQARATALDQLAESGPTLTIGPGSGSDDIERELQRLSSGNDVEAQLAAMRQSLPGAVQPKALPEGSAEGEPTPTTYDEQTGTHVPQQQQQQQ